MFNLPQEYKEINNIIFNSMYKIKLMDTNIRCGIEVLNKIVEGDQFVVDQICEAFSKKDVGELHCILPNIKKILAINVLFFIANHIGKYFGLSFKF